LSNPSAVKETGQEFPGSPFVALDYGFADYILIEQNPDLVDAVKKRVSEHPKARKVTVLHENWARVAESGQLSFDTSTVSSRLKDSALALLATRVTGGRVSDGTAASSCVHRRENAS
jgi:hypothetical protein